MFHCYRNKKSLFYFGNSFANFHPSFTIERMTRDAYYLLVTVLVDLGNQLKG